MTPIRNRLSLSLVYATLALFALITSVPFLWTFIQSLKNVRQAYSRTPLFIFKPTLESYAELWLESVPKNMPLLTVGFVVAVLAIILLASVLRRARVSGLIVAGFVACWIWRSLIHQYEILIGWWYTRLREMEEKLPNSSKLITLEYQELYTGDKKIGMTPRELILNGVFIALYAIFAIGIVWYLLF